MTKLSHSDAKSIVLLAGLIHERTGLTFESSRLDWFVEQITPLVVRSQFRNYLDYYYYLKYDDQAHSEWQQIQSALAVNETYFWREYDGIQAVVNHIVPALQKERPGIPVRIWHAACATGEEPYTMAISLVDSGRYSQGDIVITATDFNLTALAQARSGVYRKRSFRVIPPSVFTKHFSADGSERFKLNDSIRALVNFQYLNLMDEEGMAKMRNYDIIICRNAFIYFSEKATRTVVNWFYESLNTSGYLLVAAAESLLRLTNRFDLVEVDRAFLYQKRKNPGNPSHWKG